MKRWQFLSFLSLLAMVLSATAPLGAQVVESAREGGIPVMVGGGVAAEMLSYDGSHKMGGFTGWADLGLDRMKFVPRGLKLEGEVQSIRVRVPQGFSQFSETTALVGLLYSARPVYGFKPYVKAEGGLGFITFPPLGGYQSDSRGVGELGLGVERKVVGNFWLRAGYEGQLWEKILDRHMTPNGVQIGVLYNFGNRTRFK